MLLTERQERRARFIRLRALSIGTVLVLSGALTAVGLYSAYRMGVAASQHRPRLEEGAKAALHLASVPVRYVRNAVAASKLDAIRINIKFKNWEKLLSVRERAMARGALLNEKDDWVPAEIEVGEQTLKAEIRLKGLLQDHWNGSPPWSLRVKIKGSGALHGMRAFSLQHPRARAFEHEPLIMAHMRSEGVLAPHFSFVRAEVNGTDWGVLELEEYPGADLLENQGRKAGPILAHDTDFAAERLSPVIFEGSPYYNTWALPVKALGASKGDDKVASLAKALMVGFQRGVIPASQILDAEKFAAYASVLQLWQTAHASYPHNLRLYFNPFTNKFEPIAYDSEAIATPMHPLVTAYSIFLAQLGADESFSRQFAQTSRQVADAVLNGDRIPRLKAIQDDLSFLDYNDPLREPVKPDHLRETAQWLKGWGESALYSGPVAHSYLLGSATASYPSHAAGWILSNGDGQATAVIGNWLPMPLTITAATAKCADRVVDLPLSGKVLPPTPIAQRPAWLEVAIPGGDCTVSVTTRRSDESAEVKERTDTISEQVMRLDRHPDAVLAARPLPAWLRWDGAAGRYVVPAGTRQTVAGPLVLPPGRGLLVEAGVELRFAADALLHVEGPLDIAGTPERPVVFTAQDADARWKGIFVNAGHAAMTWRSATFAHLAEYDDGTRHLTGALTVREADLSLNDVSITDAQSEDGINLVHSRTDAHHLTIIGTHSDAVDVDFGEASFRDTRIERANGDGLDFSGARITVTDFVARAIRDKAVSVGEGTTIAVDGLTATDVGTGVAAKDASQATVRRATIKGANVAALMAYTKKPEYGPAMLTANDITVPDSSVVTKVQNGSTLTLDGRDVSPDDLDVKALYRGAMRKK